MTVTGSCYVVLVFSRQWRSVGRLPLSFHSNRGKLFLLLCCAWISHWWCWCEILPLLRWTSRERRSSLLRPHPHTRGFISFFVFYFLLNRLLVTKEKKKTSPDTQMVIHINPAGINQHAHMHRHAWRWYNRQAYMGQSERLKSRNS